MSFSGLGKDAGEVYKNDAKSGYNSVMKLAKSVAIARGFKYNIMVVNGDVEVDKSLAVDFNCEQSHFRILSLV
jgi:hypothetical protein